MAYMERDASTPVPVPIGRKETKPKAARYCVTYRVTAGEPAWLAFDDNTKLLTWLNGALKNGHTDIRVWTAMEWAIEVRTMINQLGVQERSNITIGTQTYSQDRDGQWEAWRGGPNDR